jgi:hypothetical protein
MQRTEIVDGVRLLRRRAAEERSAVDHGIDAVHRGRERVRAEQIAFDELDAVEVGGARDRAEERHRPARLEADDHDPSSFPSCA